MAPNEPNVPFHLVSPVSKTTDLSKHTIARKPVANVSATEFCSSEESSALCGDAAAVSHVISSPPSAPTRSLLPPPPHSARYSWLRWGFFTIYRRLFSIVFIANFVTFIIVIRRDRSLTDFVNAAAANLLGVGLARQPLVVNLLFWCICSLPKSAPLRLRRLAAKISHYGGVHSGCGVASLLWYIGFIGVLSHTAVVEPRLISPAVLVLAYVILLLLLAIVIAAYPTFRFKRHDYFEFTHRFSGWLVILLFWPFIVLFAEKARLDQSTGAFLATQPAFWILIFLTLSIVHPWLYLRKVDVVPEYISTHAIRLHFNFTTIRFGQGFAVSKHPLRDWHGFAQFPDLDGKGFSCLVSKAGDWTTDCIQRPPTHLWKRGVPIFGFGYTMRMFRSIVIVTTGSGIGPILSFLAFEQRPPMRVVWQTKAPLKTYGQGILDCLAHLDPDPVIVDTDKSGRQDLLPMVLDMVRNFNAEAVLVVSNPFFTKKMVFELEARDVPAYGPIFDS